MELVIEVTDRCHNNCVHCSSNSNASKALFLPVSAIEKAIQDVNPGTVILSGGEPFLHPKIGDIISTIKDLGIKLAVNTCGVFKPLVVPGNIDRIDEIYVSWFGERRDITRFDPPIAFMHPFGFVMNARFFGAKRMWINTVVLGAWQIVDIPEACFHAGLPVHVMRLVDHGRASDMRILPLHAQRAIATTIIDQLDPAKASRRPPAFLCRDRQEVLPDDIERLEAIHPLCKASHSLFPGQCRAGEKRTLLPDGRLIGCVAGKGRDEAIGKFRACD